MIMMTTKELWKTEKKHASKSTNHNQTTRPFDPDEVQGGKLVFLKEVRYVDWQQLNTKLLIS